MADRRSAGSAKKTRGRGLSNKAARKVKESLPPKTNQEIMDQRLRELSTPVLEKYGVPAFDELMVRLETTIKDFNTEVTTLFDEMVHQSREDHERLKSMLAPNSAVKEGQAEELENQASMSEYELRLENMEREQSAKSHGKGKE